MTDSSFRRCCRVVGAAFLLLVMQHIALAQTTRRGKVEPPRPSDAPASAVPAKVGAAPGPQGKPADYKSEHFVIHTDLEAKEAKELLSRLESMLVLLAKYWQQPLAGTIECYVVRNPDNWSATAMPQAARAKVSRGAGLTSVESMLVGGRTVAAKALVFASSEHGSPQHEAVHAYCGQTFGRLGPLWYSEGMAEMGQYWRAGEPGVNCHPYVAEYLRKNPPKPLSEILSEDAALNATGDSWQNYAWRWALCYLLDNNPNYQARFRQLGLGYLNGQRVHFNDSFGSMLDEIAFEYRFFVKHVEAGYRVDLCSWDWKRKFRAPTKNAAVTARVAAARGWQPSGVLVSAGKTYNYSATGNWQMSKDGEALSADGGAKSLGRLEGVILKDFTLSEPIPMGASGTLTASSDGQLYLRAHDAWNAIADNRGTVAVKIEAGD